jgi:hypothetical protein
MSTINIRQKLQGIQTSLKAPKGQTNKFGGYSYRSAEDIMLAVKPLLAEYGCSLIVTDHIAEIAGRFYVRAAAVLLDNDDMTQELTAHGFAREAESKKGMDDSQLTGSTSSYARKYALAGLLCIDSEKDSDSTNTHGRTNKPQTKNNSLEGLI